MDEPLTEELLDELLAAPSPQDYLARHRFDERSLAEQLTSLLERSGRPRAQVVREAGVNETFGYQVFTGARGAGRDTVLQLAFALRATLLETNRLLRAAGAHALHPKNRRDAIIIYCLDHGATLQQANETLYSFGEETVC